MPKADNGQNVSKQNEFDESLYASLKNLNATARLTSPYHHGPLPLHHRISPVHQTNLQRPGANPSTRNPPRNTPPISKHKGRQPMDLPCPDRKPKTKLDARYRFQLPVKQTSQPSPLHSLMYIVSYSEPIYPMKSPTVTTHTMRPKARLRSMWLIPPLL